MNENFMPDKAEDNSKTGEFELNDITARSTENSDVFESAPEDEFIIGGGFNISDEDVFIEELECEKLLSRSKKLSNALYIIIKRTPNTNQ